MSTAEVLSSSGRLIFSEATFASLGVDPRVVEALDELGFTRATEVQKACFEQVVAGNDIVVQSRTGSGKTAAFGIPVCHRMEPGKVNTPRVLVLCPTRELASQVEHELMQIGRNKGIRTLAIYGGVGFGKQNETLQNGVDIVVGTPGRLMDQVEQGNLSLKHLETLVLDEADEMLSMGFWDDVMWLVKKTPKTRQTLLFSATLPFPIEKAARTIQNNPTRIDLSTDAVAASSVTHYAYETDARMPKPRNLLYLLEVERPESAIIFCNTRSDVGLIGAMLGNQGYDIETLSGDLSQTQREKVMRAIKLGKLRFMVATDIAARGIDISDLTHVVNYSLPEDPEVYVHRSGRTGRIGRTGLCVSLVSGSEEHTKTVLKRDFSVVFNEKKLPEMAEVARLRSERIVKELLEKAQQSEVGQHMSTAEAVLGNADSKTIVAFLVKQYLSKASRPSLLDDGAAGSAPNYTSAPPSAPRSHADRPPMDRGPRPAARGEQRHHEPRRDEPRREARQSEPRPPREPRPEGQEQIESLHRRLFINVGEADNFTAETLVAQLAEKSGVPASAFLKTEVRKISSFLKVETAHADALLKLHGSDFANKSLILERQRRR